METRYGRYQGDKENSVEFWKYLDLLYDWRERAGLLSNLCKMDHIITQVRPGARVAAVKELLLVTGYEYLYSFEDSTYRSAVLGFACDPLVPEIVLREPKSVDAESFVFLMNNLAPARRGSLARFVGEAYLVNDVDELFKEQNNAGTKFATTAVQGSRENGCRYVETMPSCYTQNSVTYVQYIGVRSLAARGKVFEEQAEDLASFREIKLRQKNHGLRDLMLPIDHLATRVMQQDRENAVLEIIKLTHHYAWGAYNIVEQNSSTNPTRNAHQLPEKHSPAKVVTAGNSPWFLDFLEKTENPTDLFALNFGRSLHHIAFAVLDCGDGVSHIDAVTEFVKCEGQDFLGELYGTREEGIRQIFSKRLTELAWVVEYVQRFDAYQGFFTTRLPRNYDAAIGDRAMLRLKTA